MTEMKRWQRMLLVVLYLIALALTAYPFLTSLLFERQAAMQMQAFQETIGAAREEPKLLPTAPAEQPEPGQETDAAPEEQAAPIFPELHQAMEAYNSSLFTQEQAGLTGPAAYEAPGIDLSNYGLEVSNSVGYLHIPAIDVTLPLYLGASKAHMALGATVLGQTSLPIGGDNTNCVIAAHRGYSGIPYFREIEQLQVGDLVEVTNPWETLRYAVSAIAIILPDDVEAVKIQPGRDMITLLTCHPYRISTHRYLVYCQRIPDAETAPQAAEPVPPDEVTQGTALPDDTAHTVTQVPAVPDSAGQAAPTGSCRQEIRAEQVVQGVGVAFVLLVGLVSLMFYRRR